MDVGREAQTLIHTHTHTHAHTHTRTHLCLGSQCACSLEWSEQASEGNTREMIGGIVGCGKNVQ